MIEKFMVTFGQKYRQEPHPFIPAAHPDGVGTVWAKGYEAAVALVQERTGIYYSGVYEWSDDDVTRYYPRGSLFVIADECDLFDFRGACACLTHERVLESGQSQCPCAPTVQS